MAKLAFYALAPCLELLALFLEDRATAELDLVAFQASTLTRIRSPSFSSSRTSLVRVSAISEMCSHRGAGLRHRRVPGKDRQ
jgi:hypothetical protein